MLKLFITGLFALALAGCSSGSIFNPIDGDDPKGDSQGDASGGAGNGGADAASEAPGGFIISDPVGDPALCADIPGWLCVPDADAL